MGDISIVYMCVCVPDDGSWDIGDIGEVYLCVCVCPRRWVVGHWRHWYSIYVCVPDGGSWDMGDIGVCVSQMMGRGTCGTWWTLG